MDYKIPNCTMSTKNINWRHLAPEMQNLKQLLRKKYIKMYHSEKQHDLSFMATELD